MMNDILIEKYFNNALSPEETEQFQQLIETDKEFKETFEFQKDVKAALIDNKKEALKNLMQQKEEKNTSLTKKGSTLKYLVAALLLVALTVSAFFALQSSPKTPQELYAENFVPYRNVIAPITRGQEELDFKEKAFYKYETGEYLKASLEFDTLLSFTNESYYIFYKANALLKLQEYKKAIQLLKKHQTYNDDFHDKSRWYLALAFLQTNNISESKKILEEIVTNATYNYKLARKILKRL